jgi:two-component system phosphate regulon sensor histidine kinase PhoR
LRYAAFVSWTTILLMLLAGLAGAGVAALLYLPTRRSIRELRETAEAFSRGDWRERADVAPSASEEVRRLGELVNDTAEQTLRQLKDLSRQKGDLEALVDSLPDPLVLADTRRKIIRINRPAAELLGVSRELALGESLEAAVTDPAVLSIFDEAARIEAGAKRSDGSSALPLRKELRLTRAGKRLAYQAVATRTGAGGVLLVLRDITTLDATLRMKSDFVANAGHELRTPIAAIKAAFETLQEIIGEHAAKLADGERKAADRCMEIIAGQLQRLEEMLRDLLDLSRVEGSEVKPTMEQISVAEISTELRQALGPMAAEKQIALELPDRSEAASAGGVPSAEAGGPSRRFTSDRRLLMLAMKNLVENAIKYTPVGGSVHVECAWQAPPAHKTPVAGSKAAHGKSRSEDLVVRVSDTGIGIPAEHLDRVFERFYQIDPARTGTNPRVSGRGTGLGLSIVKHAVSALGGSVRVESKVGEGSMFEVRLPQADLPPRGDHPSIALQTASQVASPFAI